MDFSVSNYQLEWLGGEAAVFRPYQVCVWLPRDCSRKGNCKRLGCSESEETLVIDPETTTCENGGRVEC